MNTILKRTVTVLLLAWAACLILFCIVLPRFQKSLSGPGKDLPAGTLERVRCINDNREALVRRLQVIDSAQEELILSTYSYGDDESGADIAAALLTAADRGVKVRVLVDGLSAVTSVNGSDNFRALAGHPNVEARIYNPINLAFPWSANYRMHDKYLIADHDLYILGGRNTRNVSLGSYGDKRDMDRDMLVWRETEDENSSMNQLRSYFEEVWALGKKFTKQARAGETLRDSLRDRNAAIRKNHPEVFAPVDWKKETLPTETVTLLHNPVAAGRKEPVLWKQLVEIMSGGEEVLIQSPYVICNHMMYEDLRNLHRNGTDVKVITNAPECGANTFGCADYLNQRHKLRATGMEIYEYAGPHSAHTKTVLVDDHITVSGSFNFDMRSAYLDTELMLYIDSPELNAELRELDRQYMSASRCIHSDGTKVLGENFVKPYMPIPKYLLYWVLRLVTIPVRHLL